MIAYLEGLIKTNNFVPHQICSKGPFIIYGREGAGDFGEGATYFWQVAERGGHLFLASRLEGGPLIFGAKKF